MVFGPTPVALACCCIGAGDRARSFRVALPAREDAFWGDRCASVKDPYGYAWSFATHQKDMTQEEMRRAGAEFARRMQQSQHP
ncbi:MAG TPA: hypothetical protein VF400_15070 [Anaeromyxobacteraceae bacterium]